MDNGYFDIDEEERRARWAKRIEEMKRSKRRQEQLLQLQRKCAPYLAGILVIAVIAVGAGKLIPGKEKAEGEEKATQKLEENVLTENAAENVLTEAYIGGFTLSHTGTVLMQAVEAGKEQDISGAEQAKSVVGSQTVSYEVKATSATQSVGGNINSEYAVIVDNMSGDILAQKNADTIISPASMTKVLTVLVAAEHITNLEDSFTITREITDYAYVNDCSAVGFLDGERVTLLDLFYGTVLPSGADAAAGLAIYTAGSLEAFTDLMNEKLQELGIADTAHFTNSVGLYDKEHYCTASDMAVIMRAALDNELCKEILSAHTYTTSATEQHPEGITISNWFLRRIEDKECGSGEVLCGKTGYVVQSGSCAVSFAESSEGAGYICVTVNAENKWKCIEDHAALYEKYNK